jgi:hypothetical protein
MMFFNDSVVSHIVGYSEGNRTMSGGYTLSFNGHKDPGNAARNLGSFSYQGGGAVDGFAADKIWLERLRTVERKYSNLNRSKLFWLNFYDLYTQSPLAAIDFMTLHFSKPILSARVASYYDPKTGKLDAPGFGNNLNRVIADQKRRCEAVESCAKTNKFI